MLEIVWNILVVLIFMLYQIMNVASDCVFKLFFFSYLIPSQRMSSHKSYVFTLAITTQVIDKSFGFDTAVEEAQRAINAAHVEVESVENGVGVVKLMGRYSGKKALTFFCKPMNNVVKVSRHI